MRSVCLTAVLLLCACQPQARRLLVLDLALSEPALLNGTVQPWRDEGYNVEYRRFYPHLVRADLEHYRVLLFLLGREPEAPSDALTAGDLALLTEWVLRGGVAVLGYDADGEGYLDRWTTNRWLDFLGTGISIRDRLLEDTTARAVPTTAPLQQPGALERTRGFLNAWARWTRRPAEWAHVPPAARGVPVALQQAPIPVELAPPPLVPPVGVDTITLPLVPDPKLDRATSIPEWLRQQGMRVLWAPLLPARDGRHVVRPGASLDSLVALLDVGGFNLLGGDADPSAMDSVHARWEERDAVRRAWAAAVGRLEPTSVAWIPVLDYAHARRNPADSSRGARGEGLAAPCALDSALWAEGISGAYAALGRLAAEQRTLVIALGLDIDGPRGYSMGPGFCYAAWRRGIAGLGDAARLDSLPSGARYAALRDAGLLARYYRALEDEVATRAAAVRDRILKQRRDVYFAFRLPQPPADWFTLGLLRGFGLPDRPLLLFTPELRTRQLLSLYRSGGLNLAHAVALPPASLAARDWTSLKRLVFEENDGFWLAPDEAPGLGKRVPLDSLGRLLRRLAR